MGPHSGCPRWGGDCTVWTQEAASRALGPGPPPPSRPLPTALPAQGRWQWHWPPRWRPRCTALHGDTVPGFFWEEQLGVLIVLF